MSAARGRLTKKNSKEMDFVELKNLMKILTALTALPAMYFSLIQKSINRGSDIISIFPAMSHYRRKFEQNVTIHRSRLRRFLTKVENNPPRQLDQIAFQINQEVWSEVDCLACSNCCRKMSPTYNTKDIIRISAHLGMSPRQFKEKWLYKDSDGDWQNRVKPCQFLDRKTNMCSIYEVRPADCAGFPHLAKKKMTDYMHVHKQNVQYCPATFRMVEKLMEVV